MGYRNPKMAEVPTSRLGGYYFPPSGKKTGEPPLTAFETSVLGKHLQFKRTVEEPQRPFCAKITHCTFPISGNVTGCCLKCTFTQLV